MLLTLLLAACSGRCDTIWYLDYDDDGYGNAQHSERACDAPRWHVDNPNDCDDIDGMAYPGSFGGCDGDDCNCDGQVDAGYTPVGDSGSDTGSDTGFGGDDDDDDWDGTRWIQIDVYGSGGLCDMSWSSRGRETDDICDGCTWGYDIEFDWEGDALGNCDMSGYLPAYRAMLYADYSGGGSYGYADLMFMYYSGSIYPLGYVTALSDSAVEYANYWYNYLGGYYYIYYWYGEASLK